MSYKPQVVLITGATGDFGKAFAKRFIDLGSKVILHGRNPEKLEKLRSELGGKAYPLIFDVTDKKQTIDAIQKSQKSFLAWIY